MSQNDAFYYPDSQGVAQSPYGDGNMAVNPAASNGYNRRSRGNEPGLP